jgi:transcriptional regulator with XRE-family HTH domain
MDYRKNFSTNLRCLRQREKMSLQDLASILSVTNQAVSLMELGRRSPSFEILCSIADVFNISLDELVGRTDDPTPPPPAKGGDVTGEP